MVESKKHRKFYCLFCGHAPVDLELNSAVCSDCHGEFSIPRIIKRPDLTDEEAQVLFTKKELTDQQKYGSTKRGKFRRARTKKK
jgi:hypothetical protein